ncbi:MAG: FecR family protein [Myxococcota bacterium]
MQHPNPKTLVASLIVIGLLAFPAVAENVAKQVTGQVEIGRGDPPDWRRLRTGDAIAPNERIRTGPDGRVEIAMAAGTIRVHENSMLRLPAATETADRVDLEEGNSLFDVLRRAGRRFEVHTPTVVVSVKGTRFGVDARDALGEVAVYRGVVGVREAGMADAIETLVREGFLATGGAGQAIELDLAPAGDPWSNWQDFRRDFEDRRELPARMSNVDQARAVLHRSTNAEVLFRAADRKPEIAERLRQMTTEAEDDPEAASPDDGEAPDRDADRRARRHRRGGDAPAPVPASPAPSAMPMDEGGSGPSMLPDAMGGAERESPLERGGALSETDMHADRMAEMMSEKAGEDAGMDRAMESRTARDVRRRAEHGTQDDYEQKMNEMMAPEMAGGSTIEDMLDDPDEQGSMMLPGLTLAQMEAFAEARQNVLDGYFDLLAGGSATPPTQAEFLLDLEQQLITNGLSSSDAAAILAEYVRLSGGGL